MIYSSKRNKFKNFIKTRNMKYYVAFLALLAAVIVMVIVISHNNRQPEDAPSGAEELSVTDTDYETSETEAPITAVGKYKLRVNLSTHMVSIHEWSSAASAFDEKPFKFMICSVNGDIKAGEYPGISDNSRELWHSENDLFYRYHVRFNDNISFHSAAYEKRNDAGSILPESYEKLNFGNSEYGITLLLADAKWIYENCSGESVIELYDGTDEVPDEASYNRYISLPEGVRWDPTDTASDSLWCRTRIKSLTSPDILSLKINTPAEFMMSFAKALDENDSDVSACIYITGTYDNSKPGLYAVTYNLIDIYGNHLTKNVYVTIEEPETETQSVQETTALISTSSSAEVTSAPIQNETKQENKPSETSADSTTPPALPTQKTEEAVSTSPSDVTVEDDTEL